MFDRMLGCFYGAQFDEGANRDSAWVAITVYLDGNPIELARFDNEDDAEQCALAEREEDRRTHGRFGVGA